MICYVICLPQDFSMQIYFRSQWVDKRLSYSDQDTPVQLPPQSLNILWLPDIYFPNEKEGHWHSITVPNKAITVYPNGMINFSSRYVQRITGNNKSYVIHGSGRWKFMIVLQHFTASNLIKNIQNVEQFDTSISHHSHCIEILCENILKCVC
jgi:hypothetical protein